MVQAGVHIPPCPRLARVALQMWADPPDFYRRAFHEWFNAVVTRSFPDELELGAFSNGCIWQRSGHSAHHRSRLSAIDGCHPHE